MPDCMLAKIAVGGPIPSALIEELLKAIQDEDLHVDWDELPAQFDTAEQLLDLVSDEDGPTTLQLMAMEAAGGQFEHLETFLVENAVAFDRWTEGWSGYDAKLVSFRPGMSQPFSRITDQDGEPVIQRRRIQPVLEALRAGQMETALLLLAEALGPAIPELSPLALQD